MATYAFGVATTEAGTYGLIQSCTATYDQELAEARDLNGDVASLNGYNETVSVTIEVIFDTAKSLPTIGGSLVLAGGKTTGTFRITAMSVAESNTDFTRFNLTLKRWVANTIV